MVGRMVDGDRQGRAENGPAVSALDQLAGRMGIEPEFKDATGQVRHADPKVSRALLDAMGMDAAYLARDPGQRRRIMAEFAVAH